MAISSPAVSAPELTRIGIPGTGPEDVVIDRQGRLIAGLEDGRVVRVDPSGGQVETLAQTGGRPLGLEVCSDGCILICDSPKGLLRFDPATGTLETLVESFEGRRLIFCSNVVEARDGTIYFTISSSRYPLKYYARDMAENVPTGRLFRRHTDGRVDLMLDGLFFANGIALGPDESWIIVAETNAQHLRRLWLSGSKAGQNEIFARMAGYPDNISAASDGLIWVAIASPAVPALAKVHAAPMFVRKIIARLPAALQPAPIRVGWLIAFDSDGNVVHDYRWADGTYGRRRTRRDRIRRKSWRKRDLTIADRSFAERVNLHLHRLGSARCVHILNVCDQLRPRRRWYPEIAAKRCLQFEEQHEYRGNHRGDGSQHRQLQAPVWNTEETAESNDDKRSHKKNDPLKRRDRDISGETQLSLVV